MEKIFMGRDCREVAAKGITLALAVLLERFLQFIFVASKCVEPSLRHNHIGCYKGWRPWCEGCILEPTLKNQTFYRKEEIKGMLASDIFYEIYNKTEYAYKFSAKNITLYRVCYDEFTLFNTKTYERARQHGIYDDCTHFSVSIMGARRWREVLDIYGPIYKVQCNIKSSHIGFVEKLCEVQVKREDVEILSVERVE